MQAHTPDHKEVKHSAPTVKSHTSGTTVNLRGLSTPSVTTAWACGENGTYIRTVDNGKTWECKQVPGTEKLFFRDIKAFDNSTAYIMSAGEGEESRIYKTEDGGNHWQLQLQGKRSAEFFNCMAFWNKDHGMVLSDPVDGKFKIYLTENGGAAWSETPALGMPLALKGECAFAASGSCMTTSGPRDAWFGTGGLKAARLFHTADGGKTWTATHTPILQDTAAAGIFSIAFRDANNGVVAGGDYSNPKKGTTNLAITRDGGVQWQLATATPQYYWSAVSYTPDHQDIMMIGPEQSALMDSNEAKHYKQSWKTNLNALSFWSSNRALAVGPAGAIVEFENPQSFKHA